MAVTLCLMSLSEVVTGGKWRSKGGIKASTRSSRLEFYVVAVDEECKCSVKRT